MILLAKINSSFSLDEIMQTKDINLEIFPSNEKKKGYMLIKYITLHFDEYENPKKAKVFTHKKKIYFSKRYLAKTKKDLSNLCFIHNDCLYFIKKTGLNKKFNTDFKSLYEKYFDLGEIEKFLFNFFYF